MSRASTMTFLVEVERLVAAPSSLSSTRAEIMAGVPSCISIRGNKAHVEEHEDIVGRSVRYFISNNFCSFSISVHSFVHKHIAYKHIEAEI